MKRVLVFCALCAALCGQVPTLLQVAPNQVAPNKVVAKIDGKDITAADVKAALETMPQEFTNLYQQNPTVALQQMFLMKYLSDEADKRKLAEESPLREQLAAARANMMAAAMLGYEQNHFTPAPDAVTDYYTRNLALFEQAKIKAVSISFGAPTAAGASPMERAKAEMETNLGRTQRTEDDARKRAAEALAKLKGGADFAQVAAEYSDDATSKAAGGDFGFVTHEGPQPEDFKKAVFALKPGEISDLVRQPGAILIVRLESMSTQPKGDVELAIIQQLRQDHFKQWFGELSQRFQLSIQSPEFFATPRPTGPQMPGVGPR
jgi:peptidyl-prolyl cis-trans isomerase C